MRTLQIVALASVMVISGLAQTPKIEGTWYGAINPTGTQFDIALSFQKRGDNWTGTLLLENGTSTPLTNISVQDATISFALDAKMAGVAFRGTVSDDASTITGEFTQDSSKFPFKLTRTQTPALQGAAVVIDPNELIAMMTSFSGSLSDRPFVPPVTHPAIGYGVRPAADPVARLMGDVQEGKIQLKFEGEQGYLRSLLAALNIPIESQMAVFSKTSVQGGAIGPSNPRVLYFNDSVAVGNVRGGFIEVASQDPEQGVNFYMLPQQPGDKPFFIKRGECLGCHLSRNSLDIPGMLVRSVYPAPNGTPINPLGSHLLDHRTEFEKRWGGWYVTGSTDSIRHLGNGFVTDTEKPETMITEETLNVKTLKGKFETDDYLAPYSDIVALMVFDHQAHMMNLITRVGWEYRIAASLETATGKRNETIDRQLRDATNEFVDYLLFIEERPLPAKIQGSSGFAEQFAARGPFDSKGRSLRQFDLEHRLMRYPCSYMVYSPAFDALPADAKKAIYGRISEVLVSRMTSDDRKAIVEILRDTKTDLPESFGSGSR